jgi:hypothetical protein
VADSDCCLFESAPALLPAPCQDLDVGDLVVTQDFKGAGLWTAAVDECNAPFLKLNKNGRDSAGAHQKPCIRVIITNECLALRPRIGQNKPGQQSNLGERIMQRKPQVYQDDCMTSAMASSAMHQGLVCHDDCGVCSTGRMQYW